VRFAELLHLFVRRLVQHEGEVKGARDGLVRDVVVGGADAARGDDEVIIGGHATGGFDDFGFFIGDDFDALQGDAEGEAIFGEPGAVGVDGLEGEEKGGIPFQHFSSPE
jgi:hypothetical protein